MNKIFIATIWMALCGAAHAELILPKGAKAQVKVEYVYTSAGDYRAPGKNHRQKWNARHVININAVYAADAPQPFGTMHDKAPGQKAMVDNMQAKGEAIRAKQEPTMNDMMKIVQECNENEECINRRVASYGASMKAPKDLKQTNESMAAMGKPGAPRFQLWRLVSLGGTYQVDELDEVQVFEMTCTETKVCKRTTTVKGGGEIPSPPGGRSIAGAFMFEVDGVGKDLVLSLPAALQPLPTEKKVTTSIPQDNSAGGRSAARQISVSSKPTTTLIKGNQLTASGTQTIKIDGVGPEGGTWKVSWTLTAQP